jgi:hypothetical protein
MKGGGGVAFLVAAGLTYEAIAACCSSPQTVHINAKRRADSLMLWVNIGVAQALVFVVLAAMLDRKHAPQILGGGGLAAVLMYGQYVYAKQRGLKEGDLPGTEDGTGGASDTPMAYRRGN